MYRLDIEQCTKLRIAFLRIHCALLILIILISPTYGISEIHNGTGNTECLNCHSTHRDLRHGTNQSSIFQNLQSMPENFQLFSSSGVVGNITLITSLGQNWYQQGIFGPSASGGAGADKSWGWTFFDETPASGFITPLEPVTQRNKIYAMLLDSGNNSSPITGAQVTSNITYWTYDGASYANHTSQVPLIEDINRRGFYSGNFYFYGGTSYSGGDMSWCDGCHLAYSGGTDTQVGYFPGNYTAVITANADGKTMTANSNFEVTPWGCEDCHGSGNQHRTNQNIVPRDMDSACYLCHGINQITHDGTDAGNPHQNTAHRNIECIDCHTNKNLDPRTFNGVSFTQGGFNNAPLPQYNHETTELNAGMHVSLSCTDCHDDLMLPDTPGGYRPDNYTINNLINTYDPSFASLQQFNDYYVINVTQGGPLNISFDWEGTKNLGFYLYPPNFNPKNRTTPLSPNKGDYPYYDGATSAGKPEKFSNNTPLQGKWILEVYGYDLIESGWTWFGILQAPINYTVKSTYPIQRKDLPKIPECNDCHNSVATEGAFTTNQIPDWNPGFAHVDTNNDGNPDIQCRMCHDAMHDITVKNCRNCHTTAPVNHPVQEPLFTQYTPAECLNCHGDPHQVTSAGGTDCIACHSDEVNISLFGRHAKINDSNEAGNVTNDDCWTCHYQKDMNRSNVYLCESCHFNFSGIVNVTDPALIKSDLMHGMATTCKACHAPATPGFPKAPAYHLNGSVGPLGLVEKILEKLK